MTTILVIEDEHDVRENLQEILEMEDFNVLTAENGKIGLQIAIDRQPNLIICDVMMPELDGYGVISSLRQNPLTIKTPFIFLSAKSTDEDREKGLKLGANDYLTKPFTPKQICKAIDAMQIES
jgi:two-component system, sensor histidine kinase and response regulator